ncbi:MAG: VWA domain-containing protein [Nitrospira sp.]|nr:VWA domain-containing protein [Nitrospira sp.]
MDNQQHDQRNARAEGTPQPLYVTFILDETGSMQSCKEPTIAGFNRYLAELRKEPADTQVTLTLFNSSKTEVRHRSIPAAHVRDLDVETYRPRDTTPLYDAIGHSLETAKRDAPADTKKLCVILTDGLENASKSYTRTQIFDLIKACEGEGWRFLYLGADHDVWAAGESLGIAGNGRVCFSKREVAETFQGLSDMTSRYRRSDETKQRPS